MNEFIIVKFREHREVLIDGFASGYFTGQVIELGAGTHTISLEDPQDYLPEKKDINPSGTSSIKPETINFL